MTGRLPVALMAPQFGSHPERIPETARKVEAMGFGGVFVVDHLVAPSGDDRPVLEMTAALGAVAAATREVDVGTLVARASARPAWTTAHVAWTVQAQSDGRMILGLGLGDRESAAELRRFGVSVPRWGERVRRARQVVDAVDRPELRLPGTGRPRIWLGGRSAEVIRLAAEIGDGWNQWGGTAEQLRIGAGVLAEHTADPITLSWGGRVALPGVPVSVGGDDLVSGSDEEIAASLRAYREAGADQLVILLLGMQRDGVLERFAELAATV